MAYVVATPAVMASAATDIAGIGSTVHAANAAAAAATTNVAAAAADEISAAIVGLFNANAQEYQALSTQVAALQSRFISALNGAAESFANAEATNVSLVRNAIQELFNGAGQAVGEGADSRPASAEATTAGAGEKATATSPTAPPGAAGAAAEAGATSGNTTSGTATGGAGAALKTTATTSSTAGGAAPAAGSSEVASASTGAASLLSATSAGAGSNGLEATYNVGSQWDKGFVANYTITNSGAAPMSNWQLQFRLPENESITNTWGAQLAHSGDQYTLTPQGYNATIAPGDSVTVGFQGAHTGSYGAPTDVLLNGQPAGGSTTPPTTTPPTTTPPTTTPPTTTPPVVMPPVTGTTGLQAAYSPTSQWNSGYTATYTITNTGTTPMTDWQLQFQMPENASITNAWSGQLAHSGSQYTITPESYNATIAPGDSVTVGFQAAHNGSYAAPTDVLVNGHSVTGGPSTPPTTTPPTTTPPTTAPPTTSPPATGSGLTATYTTPSQWNGGYVANYTITNSGATPITNWQLQFQLPENAAIGNAWSSTLAHTGSQYALSPASYNATIAPGDSIAVGYQASQTGNYTPPTNLLINGHPVTLTPPTTTPPATTPPTTAPPTTTPPVTTPPTGGTVISTQYGTTTVNGGYVVQNNAWNNPAGQTINVSPTGGFTITQMNGSAPTNGAPLSYPSIFEGVHYGTSSTGTNLPIRLNTIDTAMTSIDYNYGTTSNSVYDAAYDIWLDSSYTTTGVNDHEIMIWLNHQGSIQPVGSPTGNVTVAGKDFTLWSGSNGQNTVTSYVATQPIEMWTFDVMDFVDHTDSISTLPVNDTWYLTSIQAGFEPWSGGVGLGIDSFSADVTTR